MKALLSTLCAATMMIGTAVPLQAAPLFVPQVEKTSPNVVLVDNHQRSFIRRATRDNWIRHWDDDDYRVRRHFRHGKRHYYNGYPGYSYYRPGYRRHGDFWFPLAAFAAGALITGAIQDRPRVVYRGGGDAHVQWCYDRYRSYRAWDNTFQPYDGPRRQCYSPYD